MITVQQLVDEAAARAGAWDGDVPFLANLALLVESCRETARLNPTGERVLHRVAVRHLRNLRYLEAYTDHKPKVSGAPLDSPIVVTGLPRTGTTLLHNLLALDPAHRVLRFWEALHPVPPGAGGPSADVLAAQAERWLASFHQLVPDFRVIHGATATGPEECDALLQNTFASQHFDDMFDARAYSSWLAGASLSDEYRHYALQLRMLTGSRWALKSPSHLGHLDALFAALPGATVVICHRHPHQAVASYASLMLTLRRAYSDAVSPAEVGRQALTRTATAMRRAIDRRGDAAVVGVSYDELVRDPVSSVAAVYRAVGRRLDGELEERIRRWVADNPRHKAGPHRYDLASFGLTENDVDAAFGTYMERFAG